MFFDCTFCRSPFAVMLDAKTTFKGLFVFDFSNKFIIEPGANVRTFGFYFEMIPFFGLKQVLSLFVVCFGLLFTFWV